MWRINPLGSTVSITNMLYYQGRTDNSWGPRAIGDYGAPVSLPKLKKAYEKRYQGHLMGPPTDSGPSGSARVFQMVSPPLHGTDKKNDVHVFCSNQPISPSYASLFILHAQNTLR
ncbi:unnamed protein product, partial [Staurois parvus]